MKKILFFAVAILIISGAVRSQSHYWVMLTDKAGTTFDPYSYFDAKAIERYRLNNADLYDISNYPLNESYVYQIDALVSDDFGQSRWLNAVAVTATPEQIAAVMELPFVKEVVALCGDMQVTEKEEYRDDSEQLPLPSVNKITNQLLRMRGELFVDNGIDGKGLRIAVFDGGFHAVNTHQAFKHLRDEGRILATWDFTKKRENVYDNHTHGTMVLSCIAGKLDDKQLGLATGASFLLAKTEVDPEPFKEEVWWQQAVEWADKNGADIINSSLGYTKDRHYTWQMDGRSYVSKAANMAARKGILVCNSAGNSGADNKWKIIGAPADADSILSVGGISPSLSSYQHISFSSYGPTADGRMKPNVCNFGYAECADPHDDNNTEFAAGTSFSSPLTTGFVACAWQTMRNKSAMQMKEEIEKSADLYPYYDYAFGYGVPQASYFVNSDGQGSKKEPTFTFEDKKAFVLIQIHPRTVTVPLPKGRLMPDGSVSDVTVSKEDVVMFKLQDAQGHIERYVNLGGDELSGRLSVAIPKAAMVGYTLVSHVNGFTSQYRLSIIDSLHYATQARDFEYYMVDTDGYIHDEYSEYENRTLADNKVSNIGVGQRHQLEPAFQVGVVWTFNDDLVKYGIGSRIAIRYLFNIRKWYGLGAGLEAGSQAFRYQQDDLNIWDNSLGLPANINVDNKEFTLGCLNLELFQRIRFVPGGSKFNKGLHWDVGIYGGVQYDIYSVTYNADQNANCNGQTNSYSRVKPIGDSYLQWGLTTRLVWDYIGVFARMRMSQSDISLPRLEIGVQLSF